MVFKERRAIRKVKVRVGLVEDMMTINNSIREEIPVPSFVYVKEETFDPLAVLVTEEISAPFVKGPCHWRAGLVLGKYVIQEADLDRLRIMYTIPDEFRMIVLGSNERVIAPPPDCVAFYEDAFEMGVRFPLHQFIRDILDFYQVAPT